MAPGLTKIASVLLVPAVPALVPMARAPTKSKRPPEGGSSAASATPGMAAVSVAAARAARAEQVERWGTRRG